MSLRHGVLGFLNYGSMTGYDLNKAFSQSVDFFWHAQTSQIYREFAKLEQEGFVKHSIIVQNDRPNKKEYTITNTGKNELFNWLSDQASNETTNFKSEFLMKLFFSDSISLETSLSRLENFKAECLNYAKSLSSTPDAINHYKVTVDNKIAPIYWQLTADYGELYIRMCITWAEQSIKKIKDIINENNGN